MCMNSVLTEKKFANIQYLYVAWLTLGLQFGVPKNEDKRIEILAFMVPSESCAYRLQQYHEISSPAAACIRDDH